MGEEQRISEIDEEVKGSPQGFRAFLESREPAETVGWAQRGGSCPLAAYLSTLYPGADIAVEPDLAHVGTRLYDTQKWMDGFIEATDGVGEGVGVSASSALFLLSLALGEA